MIIKNGFIVKDNKLVKKDLLIENNLIVKIADDLQSNDFIDATK